MPQSTFCRLGLSGALVPAEVQSSKILLCNIFPGELNGQEQQQQQQQQSSGSGSGSAVGEKRLEHLYVSNDAGQRWVTNLMTFQEEPQWSTGYVPRSRPSAFNNTIHVVGLVPNKTWYAEVAHNFDVSRMRAQQQGFLPDHDINLIIVETKLSGQHAVEALRFVLRSTPNLVGVVGGGYSTTTLPIVKNVTLGLQIPTVAYDAWTAELSDSSRFPYFIRTCPSNVNIAQAFTDLMIDMAWARIAILTSNDAYASNLGDLVSADFLSRPGKKQEVLYRGTFNELNASSSEQDVAALTRTSAAMLRQSRAMGATVVYVEAAYVLTLRGVLQALSDEGFQAEGFALLTTKSVAMLEALRTPQAAHLANGFLLVEPGASVCGSSMREMCNQVDSTQLGSTSRYAYDAMQVLLRGIAPSITERGGEDYLLRQNGARERAMGHIRSIALNPLRAASGRLRYTNASANDRDKSNFRFTVWNAYNTTAVLAGEMTLDGFQADPRHRIVWPGGTLIRPLDIDIRSTAPPDITLGLVTDGYLADGRQWFLDKKLKYAAWMVDRINDMSHLLPYTKLHLAYAVPSTNVSVKAFANETEILANAKRLQVEAALAGRPLAAYMTPMSTTTITASSVGPVTCAYWSSLAALASPADYPNVVRTSVASKGMMGVFLKLFAHFTWDRVMVISDASELWSRSWATDLADYIHATTTSEISIREIDFSKANSSVVLDKALRGAAEQKFRVFLTTVWSPLSAVQLVVEGLERHGLLGDNVSSAIIFPDDYPTSYLPRLDLGERATQMLDGALYLVSPGNHGVESELEEQLAPLWPHGKDRFLDYHPANGGSEQHIAYLLDAIYFLAHGIHQTIREKGDPLNVTLLRSALDRVDVEGFSGSLALEPGSNDRGLNLMEVGTIISANASATNIPTFDLLTKASSDDPYLEVCSESVPPAWGPSCGQRVDVPQGVGVITSTTAMNVSWTPPGNAAQSGYRLTISSADGNRLVEDTLGPDRDSATYDLMRHPALSLGVVYDIRVHAQYNGDTWATERNMAESIPAFPPHRGGAISCMPEPNATRTCGCRPGEMHTFDLAPASQWQCKVCRRGLVCRGGTAFVTTTRAGWFLALHDVDALIFDRPDDAAAGQASSVTGLHACVGGNHACPGGWPVGPLIQRTRTQVSPTAGGAANGDGLVDLAEFLFAQCGTGFTGMLCTTCADGFFMNRNMCHRCTHDKATSSGVFWGALGGALLVAAGVAALGKLLARPPRAERAMIKAFRASEAAKGLGGGLATLREWFSLSPDDSAGVSKPRFTKGLQKHVFKSPASSLSSSSKFGGLGNDTKRTIDHLWRQLDENNDGAVTEDELLRFCYHLSSGQASSNAWRARIVRAWAWVASAPVQTIFSVLLTFYQIDTSRSRSFPDYRPWAAQDETPTIAAETNATGNLDVEEVKKALNPLVELLTNVNLMAFDFAYCGVGPRHFDQLLAFALVMIALPALMFIAYLALRVLDKCSSRGGHAASLATKINTKKVRQAKDAARNTGMVVTTVVAALCYPSVAARCVRTFVCHSFEGPGGEIMSFMVDDSSVRCDGPGYQPLVVLAVAILVTIVFGIPVAIGKFLWAWRYPFDRLYAPDDDTDELKPSANGLQALGVLYELYRTRAAFLFLMEIIAKLMFVAVFGLIFKSNQRVGMGVSGLFAIMMGALYLRLRPFAYDAGNSLACLAFFANALQFLGPAIDQPVVNHHQGPHWRSEQSFNEVVKVAAFCAWLAPPVASLWLIVGGSCARGAVDAGAAGAAGAAGGRGDEGKESSSTNNKSRRLCKALSSARRVHRSLFGVKVVEAKSSDALEDYAKRLRLFASTFWDLRKVVARAQRRVRRRLRRRVAGVAGATVIAPAGGGIDTSTADTSSGDGDDFAAARALAEFRDAVEALVRSLDAYPLSLTWALLEDAESKAKALAIALYRDDPSVITDNPVDADVLPGQVSLRFSSSRPLWDLCVTRFLAEKHQVGGGEDGGAATSGGAPTSEATNSGGDGAAASWRSNPMRGMPTADNDQKASVIVETAASLTQSSQGGGGGGGGGNSSNSSSSGMPTSHSQMTDFIKACPPPSSVHAIRNVILAVLEPHSHLGTLTLFSKASASAKVLWRSVSSRVLTAKNDGNSASRSDNGGDDGDAFETKAGGGTRISGSVLATGGTAGSWNKSSFSSSSSSSSSSVVVPVNNTPMISVESEFDLDLAAGSELPSPTGGKSDSATRFATPRTAGSSPLAAGGIGGGGGGGGGGDGATGRRQDASPKWLKRGARREQAATPLGITQNLLRAENESLRTRVQALEAEIRGLRQ